MNQKKEYLKNNSIKTLNLSNNKIGDEGCKAIFNTLKVNSTLQTLHLSCNKIGKEGCRAIFNTLKVNSSIKNCSDSLFIS